MTTELDVLRDMVKRLADAQIDYMLTGSLALNYYAEPRMTRDIDLVVGLKPTDAGRIRAVFEPDYYVPADELEQALASQGMFNLIHNEAVVKVDIIVRKNESYRQTEFARRREVELSDFRLWIVSKEDLILSKLVWAKASASELQLGDVRSLIATGADMEYLRKWSKQLDVSELLEQCAYGRHQS